VGGFDEDLPRSQDLDFGLRVADLGVPLVVERRAVSHHLHQVTASAFARQCLSEGRCVVRISRKRGVPVELLLEGLDRPIDRLLKQFWIRYPRWADAGGRVLSGLLRAADLLGLRPAQVVSSRALRRFHELGGIAMESAR
jgi:GT2 family glycosyltransferase